MKCPSWPSLLETIKSLANPFEVQIFTKQVSCLLLLLPPRRAQVRWNTEHWTVYLSSKMHLVLHLRSHDLCTSTLLFLHPQISHFSSKKTLVTLDRKKACSSSSITYSHIGRQIFFLQAPYLTCSVLWKTHICTGWTHLSLQLTPWQHFRRKHTQLYHSDLKLKAKKTPVFSGQEPSTAIQRQSRGPVSSLKYISLEHRTGYKSISSARGPQQVISGEWGMQGALRAKQCCNSAVK